MGRGSGVRATSDNTIQIDFRHRGIRYRERLKLAPTPANLKYATRLKATIEHEIATNTFDYTKHFPDSARAKLIAAPGRTLRQQLLDYCDSLSGSVEPETARDYRNDSEIVAGWFEKEKTLATLSRTEIRNALARQTLSKQRLSNLLRPLRGAFSQALEDGLIAKNPLHGFRLRRVEHKQETIDPFTPEEIERLSRTPLGTLWTFWAWTGPRSGEVIGLQWQDVELDCKRIEIRRAVRLGREKQPKTKAGIRKLTLLPAARAALQSLQRGKGTEPVFLNPNTGDYWHEAKSLARAFARACKACGVRYRYVYQLRHSFATWAISSGENPLWIARHMGHKDTSMLFRHYGKWMPDLDPKAGSRMVGAAGAVSKKAVA